MIKNPDFIKGLIEKKILAEKDCESLIKACDGDDLTLLQRLCGGGRGSIAAKGDIARIWADSLGCPYMEIPKTLFQPQIVQKLDEKFARENKFILVYQFGDTITAAAADPQNVSVLNKAVSLVGEKISAVFGLPDEIDDAIDVQYKSQSSLEELNQLFRESNRLNLNFFNDKEISKEDLDKTAGNDAIIELSRGILLFAVKEMASDIHIEPFENMVRVRFRIDGVLQERLKLEKSIHLPLISRFKLMSNLDITERRNPQDGSLSLPLTHRSIDFRVSSAPSIHGEKLVLRTLGQATDKVVPDIEELCLSHKNLRLLKSLIEIPNGVIFITGPTGSGKTTTLFSILQHLNKPDINIITIEDPVEYHLPGVTQVQVNHKINLNFSSALRCFLRQDPDVMLVGEIRDLETAQIASQAALTGHLVMTSMHANNAFQAITRLIEIGVEPFLVASSVVGVMAQRLVRRLCQNCNEKYALSREEKGKYFNCGPDKEVFFYKGRGCLECDHSGFKGRIAIHEIFIIDDKSRELIVKNGSGLQIQKTALAEGFQTLRYDGIKKVLRGLTSIDEINRVTIRQNEMCSSNQSVKNSAVKNEI